MTLENLAYWVHLDFNFSFLLGGVNFPYYFSKFTYINPFFFLCSFIEFTDLRKISSQEPKALWDMNKIVPISKIDKTATDEAIKKNIDSDSEKWVSS